MTREKLHTKHQFSSNKITSLIVIGSIPLLICLSMNMLDEPFIVVKRSNQLPIPTFHADTENWYYHTGTENYFMEVESAGALLTEWTGPLRQSTPLQDQESWLSQSWQAATTRATSAGSPPTCRQLLKRAITSPSSSTSRVAGTALWVPAS